jgi:SHS2 domain-containing protein
MSRPTEGFDHFEVAADVGVWAWGTTLADAFRQCALGVFHLIVERDQVSSTEHREVRATGESRESLLVNWINELLYLQDIEGFLVKTVTLPIFGEGQLHSVLGGEILDPERHRPGIIVKAATFHELSIHESDAGWDIKIILDV